MTRREAIEIYLGRLGLVMWGKAYYLENPDSVKAAVDLLDGVIKGVDKILDEAVEAELGRVH